jgi:hypothetical protein
MSIGSDRQATLDAIDRISTDGSDMARPMEVDFFLASAARPSADSLAELNRKGFRIEVGPDDDHLSWTVTATRMMIVSAVTVEAIEAVLIDIARKHGLLYDGFGSFGNSGPERDQPAVAAAIGSEGNG